MARFVMPFARAAKNDFSGAGSGWKLNFYESGTTNRKDTFSDSALTTANANPVVADSAGRFGDIFLESGTYRVILTDADDVTISDDDPVDGAIGVGGGVVAKSAAYTVAVGDQSKVIGVDATSGATTITLLAAATAGDGFEITVKKTDSSTNSVTVDGNGSETIDGAATYSLSKQYDSVTLRCDGAAWHVVAHDHPDTIDTGNDVANSMGGSLAFAQSEITIAAGVITPTRTFHNVDTEADASTDELSTAIATSVSNNAILIIKSANGGRVVTVKHNTDEGSTGNPRFYMADGQDFVLSHLNNSQRSIGFQLRGSSEWHEIFRSDNSQGIVLQEVYNSDATYANDSANNFPKDDTVPQNTEGAEAVTVSITPRNTNNILLIEAGGLFTNSVSSTHFLLALFQDSTANALAATGFASSSGSNPGGGQITHRMTAGTTSSTTFKLRYGASSGTTYRNGDSTSRLYGGVASSWIRVTEISV